MARFDIDPALAMKLDWVRGLSPGFSEIWCSVSSTGWPTRREMIERYRKARSVGVVPGLTYYEALHNLRLAVLLEGSYQRSLRDPKRADRHDLGDRVLSNMARAVALAAQAP